MGRLNGKVALVTGGSTGIGLATAQRFAAEGADVFIIGRRQAELDEAAASIGHGAVAIQADVTNLSDLDRVFEVIKQAKGRLDVVVANAGAGSFMTLEAITPEYYQAVFDLNVRGVLFTVQKALPLLSDGASVILVGSTAGSSGTPAFGLYNASKAAVRSFARTWTQELASRRIRTNVLSPGMVLTPALAGAPQELLDRTLTTVPMGRMGAPEEIAGVALFLASDDSSFVTGIELFADGGAAQV